MQGALTVALRKESVDRNGNYAGVDLALGASLSARRAWIEIISPDIRADVYSVALRKESVDRNHLGVGLGVYAAVALRKESVDRNPYIPLAKVRHCEVALRKESVDRNLPYQWGVWTTARRSPQGERG